MADDRMKKLGEVRDQLSFHIFLITVINSHLFQYRVSWWKHFSAVSFTKMLLLFQIFTNLYGAGKILHFFVGKNE